MPKLPTESISPFWQTNDHRFIGSGTTCEISVELGRASVGIDLNDKYLRNNAIPRVEGALLRRADTAKLATRKRAPFKPNGGKLGILKR